MFIAVEKYYYHELVGTLYCEEDYCHTVFAVCSSILSSPCSDLPQLWRFSTVSLSMSLKAEY